jgi:endonuclease/exonuclease/phosphatase family metal-dependent hydrolase
MSNAEGRRQKAEVPEGKRGLRDQCFPPAGPCLERRWFSTARDWRRQTRARLWLSALLSLLWLSFVSVQAETFRVATYNVENYLDREAGSRNVKPAAARAQVQENILALRPDVLALQEMGQRSALEELQSSLKARGLDLPHADWVPGWDTNIFVAVLSRFPFAARHPHTNDAYLLSGRRLYVSRGFAEVEVRVSQDYSFTLLTAHLKSKREVSVADQSEMRLEEARLLRRHVDARLERDPQANVLVCGDFNDFYNSPAVKVLVGRGRAAMVDTRPAEQNGDTLPHPTNPNWFPRNVAWTHHYGAEDTYSRIDYILLSAGMAREWERSGTYALTAPNWGQGSDHRPIVATFHAGDR